MAPSLLYNRMSFFKHVVLSLGLFAQSAIGMNCLELLAAIKEVKDPKQLEAIVSSAMPQLAAHQYLEVINELRTHHGINTDAETVVFTKWIDSETQRKIKTLNPEKDPKASEDRAFESIENAIRAIKLNQREDFPNHSVAMFSESSAAVSTGVALQGAYYRSIEQLQDSLKRQERIINEIVLALRKDPPADYANSPLQFMLFYTSSVSLASLKSLWNQSEGQKFSTAQESFDALQDYLTQSLYANGAKVGDAIDRRDEAVAIESFKNWAAIASHEVFLSGVANSGRGASNALFMMEDLYEAQITLMVSFNNPTVRYLTEVSLRQISGTMEDILSDPGFLKSATSQDLRKLNQIKDSAQALVNKLPLPDIETRWRAEGPQALAMAFPQNRQFVVEELRRLEKLGDMEELKMFQSAILEWYRVRFRSDTELN